MSAEPALGSLITRSAETTSTTSGVESSPPSPRMRCGMPRRPSASPKRTMCFLLRNRIAPVVGSARRAALAPDAREPLGDPVGLGVEVGVEDDLDLARGRAGAGAQLVRPRRSAEAASGASTAFAAASTCALLRQLVSERVLRRTGRRVRRLAANPPRLPALAPRQP